VENVSDSPAMIVENISVKRRIGWVDIELPKISQLGNIIGNL
jgi:hypothetical protein